MKLNLREIRENKGMTQNELAQKSGVGRITINRIENNRQLDIKTGTIVKLANALEVSINELTKG